MDEARGLAEESLTIKETLDPAAATIWTTYSLLARIADQQGDSSQAAEYRAKSRQTYLAFPGWRQQLEEDEEIIDAVVEASTYPEMQDELEEGLDELAEQGWDDLVAAIERILSGERDEAALCEPLDYEEAALSAPFWRALPGRGRGTTRRAPTCFRYAQAHTGGMTRLIRVGMTRGMPRARRGRSLCLPVTAIGTSGRTRDSPLLPQYLIKKIHPIITTFPPATPIKTLGPAIITNRQPLFNQNVRHILSIRLNISKNAKIFPTLNVF